MGSLGVQSLGVQPGRRRAERRGSTIDPSESWLQKGKPGIFIGKTQYVFVCLYRIGKNLSHLEGGGHIPEHPEHA